jgi:glutamate racemase
MLTKNNQNRAMSHSLPIGVFDSGVGGLTVLKHIRKLLPHEDLVYVADREHYPYGNKGDIYTRERSDKIAKFLINFPVKAIVVACNTATASAVQYLRDEHSIPIIGMEPAVKPAAQQSHNGKIGILATEGTLDSSKFKILLERHANGAELFIQPCHGWVEWIEQGRTDQQATIHMIRETLQPMLDKEIDTLVLGCTHYPFLKSDVQQVMGDNVSIIDTGAAVALQLRRRLENEALLKPAQTSGTERFLCSGPVTEMQLLLDRLWGPVDQVGVLPD